ncbi:hypothetical protein DFQ01_11768 [Paenibacillus cellulosilyticus]|uniref:Uncharacterized protein n=1 Tax=Paenibacillus cellulosilyticus TaxID=375489 RepID=A0A2V2YQK1_9BACL|nr:hypothetical protein [Paenibacillus cellulosilyticus]PWV98558.1 hypothetical protein DFQ01_11768 [Paenibacillus cellulosilyticus]QKS44163.1 hypothetical protein HUB94_06740 [Paenibacillus cellulosilyticus]
MAIGLGPEGFDALRGLAKKHKRGTTINIIIFNGPIINQRAEGGGQILRNVGQNANQGGQNALHGRTFNKKANFANGNGRSGIAGKKNDEQGGQGAVKNKITVFKKSKHKQPHHRKGMFDVW